MSITKKLQKWVENDLISPEQSAAIKAYELQHNGNLFLKISFSIVGLLIGLGICLIIASNWDMIPVPLRIVGAFGIFALFIYGIYREQNSTKSGRKEIFLMLCFLMVAALIGLIGQTFNLDGGWQSFATGWAVLSLPYVFLSRSRILNGAWICIFLSGICRGIVWHWLTLIFPWILDYEEYIIPLTIAAVALLTILGCVAREVDARIHKHTVLADAFEALCNFGAYYSVFFCGIYHMISRNEDAIDAFVAHILVLAYLAFRMYLGIREQNAASFKRNAFAAEVYIFLIFASCFGNLLTTGIGFILGGLLIWGLIHVLKKTSKYIKGMEIFND